MPAKITDLQRELVALQARRAAINFDALQAAFEAAKAARAAHTSPQSNGFVIDETERELSANLATARQQLDAAKSEAASLDRQIFPLKNMLTAPARIEAAAADLDGLHLQHADAQAVLTAASDVFRALEAHRADAAAQLEGDRAVTAKAILDAAKAGRNLTPTAPDRAQLLGIEAALALAESERDAAQQVVTALDAQIIECERKLIAAQCDAAGLRFELARRDFVSAAVDYELATNEDADLAEIGERVAVETQHRRGQP